MRMNEIKREYIEAFVSTDIINIIHDVYYGKSEEAIKFRIDYGSNGAVNKIIDIIVDKYLM